MASFCKVSIMAFFLFATGAFLSPPALGSKVYDYALEPSSSDGIDFIEPELLYYLGECLKKLGRECGPLFFERIFVGEKNEIPTSCCEKQVQMGETCHNAITESVTARPEFSANATLYEAKAAETWKMCTQLVKNISPSPSA